MTNDKLNLAEGAKKDAAPCAARPRPKPGEITHREIRARVCTHCGYLIGEGELCVYGCPLDGEPRTTLDFIEAVYLRTDEFLRDETPLTAREPAAAPASTEREQLAKPIEKEKV